MRVATWNVNGLRARLDFVRLWLRERQPDLVGLQELKLTDEQLQPFKTEFDVTATLKDMGHHVEVAGVYSDLGAIGKAIEAFKPHIAFNLLEEFRGVAAYDASVVSYLELMRAPYTGCNPRGLMIARDKALSKKILHYIAASSTHSQEVGRVKDRLLGSNPILEVRRQGVFCGF